MVQRLEHSKKIIIDSSTVDEVASLVSPSEAHAIEGITISFSNGDCVQLEAGPRTLVEEVLRSVSRGRFCVESLPTQVSTTVAADLLGVTRPTLNKWIQAGTISATRVGSHTKLDAEEVLRFREKQLAKRREAFDQLRAIEMDEGFR